MIVELSIPSEKVTEMVLVRPAVAESAGEDEETDGAVVSVSTMKRVAVKVFPALLELSVTFIVQLEYVSSLRLLKSIVVVLLSPKDVVVVELEQLPP